MTIPTDSATLLQITLNLVANAPRKITNKDMADACGASQAWISRFSRGMILNPAYQRLQALHDFLASQKA